MNQLLNNRVGRKPTTQKRGCLFLILGSIAALLATGCYILIVSLLTGLVIEARHGSEVGYALMTAVEGSWGAVLLLFYAILALWYVAPSQAEVDRQNRRFATMPGGHNREPAKAMPRRTLWLITAGLLLGVILAGAVALNTYKFVNEDGVRTYCFFETGSYDWDDVSAYAVDCDTDEGLSLTFSFKGGKQLEILRGINSFASAFEEKYDSPTHFAAELDKRLMNPSDDRPVPPRNMSGVAYDRAVKFYRDANPESLSGRLWGYAAQLIGYVEMDMTPDETAAETAAETDPTP